MGLRTALANLFARAAHRLYGPGPDVSKKQTNLDPTFFQRLGISLDGAAMRNAFTEHPWVFAVIASRARQVSQVPWKIGQTRTDGSTKELPNHVLNDLFERPNRAMTGDLLWMLTSVWMDLVGECFWVLDRKNVSQVPKAIWPWPGGARWQPGPLGTDDLPVGWVLETPSGRLRPLSVDQLVYFRTPNPIASLRGFPPLAPGRVDLNADHSSAKWHQKFYDNGASPGGWLKYKQPLDDTTWEEVKRRWNDEHQGVDNAHLVGVLDDDADFVQSTANHINMDFLNGRKFVQDMVCATFGWPKWALGQTDDMNFATAIAAKRTLWEENIIPMLRQREKALDAQFFRFIEGGGLTGFFDESLVPAMVQVTEAKWDTVLKMLKAGVTLKDASTLLDMGVPPQPGWDEVWRPSNMLPSSDFDEPDEQPAPAPAPEEEDEPGAGPGDTGDEGDEEGDEATEEAIAARLAGLEPIDAEMLELLTADELAQAKAERAAWERIGGIRDKAKADEERRRRRLWRNWNREVLRPSERGMVRALRPYFRDLAADQLARFDAVAKERAALAVPGLRVRQIRVEDINDIVFDSAEWDPRLRKKMRGVMEASLELAEAFTTTDLGEEFQADLLAPEVLNFLDQRMELLKRINDSIRLELSDQLRAGIANGETINQLRARIQDATEGMTSPFQALRIARTETGSLANQLRFQQATAEGGGTGIWITAGDDDVRTSHADAETASVENPVPLGQPHSNGLRFPNDPLGQASEVIQCRCLLEIAPGSSKSVRRNGSCSHTNRLRPKRLTALRAALLGGAN